ncbi:hypothetical protein PG291_05260 [Riemerella anatipestifer]|nr:hypothetical protein [Riemerella anatipestifer]
MPKKGLAEVVHAAELMLSGLKAHQSDLSSRGLDADFIKTMEDLMKDLVQANNLQEKLKADLKTQTAKVEQLMSNLQKTASEARKRVKLDIQRSQWKEFGIEDKR